MMKLRSLYLSAAFIGMAAGVLCIPAVSLPASAADVYLSPAQTRALFGNSIQGKFYNANIADYVDCTFDYLCNYTYTSTYSGGSAMYPYWLAGTYGIVYQLKTDSSLTISNDSTSQFTVKVNPIIDLSNINTLQLTMGFSSPHKDYTSGYGSSYNASALYWYKQDGNNNPVLQVTRPVWDSNNTRFRAWSTTLLDPENGDTLLQNVFTSVYSISLLNQSEPFSFVMNGSVGDAYITQKGNVEWTYSLPGSNSTLNALLFISCPYLSDTYHGTGGGTESSGGGSDSGGGYDGPDYSEQLALILAKLDLIVNNDFNIDVDLTADLAGLESRLDGVNSRLDGNNSRMDGNNSRLDGVNSRLDGVNSRLDNISGELHDLNSAPSGTLPRTGAENSEFDRQAEMYLSDIQDEYADPENLPENVVEGSSGFLSLVRDFLVRSHLAGVLPVLALLFIVHYTIFDRRG